MCHLPAGGLCGGYEHCLEQIGVGLAAILLSGLLCRAAWLEPLCSGLCILQSAVGPAVGGSIWGFTGAIGDGLVLCFYAGIVRHYCTEIRSQADSLDSLPVIASRYQ